CVLCRTRGERVFTVIAASIFKGYSTCRIVDECDRRTFPVCRHWQFRVEEYGQHVSRSRKHRAGIGGVYTNFVGENLGRRCGYFVPYPHAQIPAIEVSTIRTAIISLREHIVHALHTDARQKSKK